ncbi:MAG: ABC transporter permease [Bacteriovoracaceae bacterium]|nr:ABC transporter permease [Bacteriovoracaceae bacterium]
MKNSFYYLYFVIQCVVASAFFSSKINQIAQNHLVSNFTLVVNPEVSVYRLKTKNNTLNPSGITFKNYRLIHDLFPDISAFIQADVELSFFIHGKKIKYTTLVNFIDDKFFDYIKGGFVFGENFTSQEILEGQSRVIITPGFANKLFHSENDFYPFSINGKIFSVKGMWKFNEDEFSENESIFMPISNYSLIGEEANTKIKSFMTKNKSLASFSELKNAINLTQSYDGTIPATVSYETVNMNDNSELYSEKNSKLLVLEYLLRVGSIFSLILTYFLFKSFCSRNPKFLMKLLLKFGNKNQTLKNIYFKFLKITLLSVILTFVLNKFIFEIYFQKIPLSNLIETFNDASFFIILLGPLAPLVYIFYQFQHQLPWNHFLDEKFYRKKI